MIRTKAEWLSTFRHVGDSILVELSKSKKSHKDKAGEINKRIKEYREQEINRINDVAKKDARFTSNTFSCSPSKPITTQSTDI